MNKIKGRLAKGMTLVELVLALIVISIVAATAWPRYQDYRISATRAEVKAASDSFNEGIDLVTQKLASSNPTGEYVSTGDYTFYFYWNANLYGGYLNPASTNITQVIYLSEPYFYPFDYGLNNELPAPLGTYLDAGYPYSVDFVFNSPYNWVEDAYYVLTFSIPGGAAPSNSSNVKWPAATGNYAPQRYPATATGPQNFSSLCADLWNDVVFGYSATIDNSGADFQAIGIDNTTQCQYVYLGDIYGRTITYDFSNGIVNLYNP